MTIMSCSDKTEMNSWDLLDAVCMCHAALAQDSPEPADYYLNYILNVLFGYLTKEQRFEVEEYLAEKKYLPNVKIEIAK